jgi:hypothetical protein
MQHENDKYDHQGKEYHFLGFDELTQFTETQYLYLHSRARSVNSSIPLRVRSTTNPGGVGHVWVKERFVDCSPAGKIYIDPETGSSRVFIPAKVTDNPALVENDPGYIQRLKALPEIEKRRLLDGEWDVFEGQVFNDFSKIKHGCDDFDIPPEWEKFMAFDWGYAKPYAALWFAVDFDGVIYLYRELYGCKKGDHDIGLRQTNTEICRAIQEVERERVGFRVADPACWGPTKIKGSNQVLGPSFTEDAAKEGLYFLRADNDRIRGKQQVHQRLQMDVEENAEGEVVAESPKFVAFRSCKHFWRTMLQLRENPKNPEDVDTDQEDHIYDTLRYGFMSRPLVPKEKTKIPPGSFIAERNKLIRAKKYARRHGVSLEAAYRVIR